MSALTTHIVTNSEKREKETNQKLKQLIKSQTKAKARSLEREKSWSPKAWATTQQNRDKIPQNCRLRKVRQKGSTTLAKEHKTNHATKRSQSMNASSP
jgi:hypothetical protein